jgi:sarcosine oxidase subunit beta
VGDQRRTADVIVVGGGIIGLFTALDLRARGREVVVLDRARPGAAASSRNGGGIRQQGRALPEIALAALALARWAELDERLGGPTGYRRLGHLVVAKEADQMVALGERRQLEQQHGLETELVDEQVVRELAPGLAPIFVGGKLSRTDAMAVPALTMQTLLSAARSSGVHIEPHAEVRAVRTDAGAVVGVDADRLSVDAPLVVNAAGPWSPMVSSMAGVYVPVVPSRLHMFRTHPVDTKFADVWVASAAMDFNAVQWEDGSLMFGAGVRADREQYTFDETPVPGRLADAVHKLAELVPALAGTPIERRWTGIREFTPDMIPVIGPTEVEGFFQCTGFSGHGFALAPIIGELVGEWVDTGRRPELLAPFAPDRFHSAQSPFNYPPSPWGGATTSLVAATVPDVRPVAEDTVAVRPHSGAPATINHPPFEESA